jgi:AAA-like domain
MYTSEVSFIPFEIALKIADAAVFDRTSRHLKNIEVAVLQGTLQGKKYDEIAGECGYAAEYIKHDVGPKLWQLLSSSLGEKVSKTNLIAVLAQRLDRTEQKLDEDKETQQKIDQQTRTKPEINSKSATVLQEEIEQPKNRELESNSKSPTKARRAIENLQSLEPPIGLLPIDSPLYVERPPVEDRCYNEVIKSGALIHIKAADRMGKTSLMVRILDRAKQHSADVSCAREVHTVALNLQQVDRVIFKDIDRFLRWFCTTVTRKLHLSHQVNDRWSNASGSKGNCTSYFEDCILPEINGILVLALDGVDEVFLHPEIADDFCSLLHSWYQKATCGDGGHPLWRNLRLILVHSTEFDVPLNINKSPFNVGLAVYLQEFATTQVADLAERYGLNLSASELSKLMEVVGGHPSLIQQTLYDLAQQQKLRVES